MSFAGNNWEALLGFEPSEAAWRNFADGVTASLGKHGRVGLTQDTTATEFSYYLLDGIDHRTLWEPLHIWRETVLGRAINARKRKETWTGRFTSLAAEPEEIQETAWRRARGILRICLATTVASGDRGFDKTWNDGGLDELLPHMLISLQEVRTSGFGLNTSPESHSVRMWEEGFLDFPQGIGMRVVSRSVLLDGNTDGEDLLGEFYEKRTSMQDGAGKEIQFWLVLDTQDDNDIPSEEAFITYAYRRICGPKSERISAKQFQPTGLVVDGIVGLEGAAMIRYMDEKEMPSRYLMPSASDILWGGGAWAAWIVTLFQRAACTSLARDTAELGPSLTSSRNQHDVDVLLKLKEYWQKVIQLESKWMYREISSSTDVDRIYRDLQTTFDIEEMWEDVREQTELLARYAEADRMKRVNSVQTIGGVIVGSLVLMVGVFGTNFFDVTDIKKAFGNFNLSYFVFLVTALIVEFTGFAIVWWLISTSTKWPAPLLRKCGKWLLLPIPVVVIASHYGIVNYFDNIKPREATETVHLTRPLHLQPVRRPEQPEKPLMPQSGSVEPAISTHKRSDEQDQGNPTAHRTTTQQPTEKSERQKQTLP